VETQTGKNWKTDEGGSEGGRTGLGGTARGKEEGDEKCSTWEHTANTRVNTLWKRPRKKGPGGGGTEGEGKTSDGRRDRGIEDKSGVLTWGGAWLSCRLTEIPLKNHGWLEKKTSLRNGREVVNGN